MNIYETMFSPTCRLNEQVARQVFELLPEAGPIMILADRENNCWPSDSLAFGDLQVDEAFLAEMWSKIDDGVEPIIAQENKFTVAAAELATDKTKCGYVALFLPKQQPGSAFANAELLEIFVNMVNLVAKLVEKNQQLYELQLRQQAGTNEYVYSQTAAN